MAISDQRREYQQSSLDIASVSQDPLTQFQLWLDQAIAADLTDATAFTLCTATPAGAPSSRIVLLKSADCHGFVFFTNYQSAKAKQLAANPQACMNFYWSKLERQVTILGQVQKISVEASHDYFASRPRDSQLGALASHQSDVIEGRAVLENKMAKLTAQYEGQGIPCPPYWGGYCLKPHTLSFWQGRSSRLHDRLRYTLTDDNWDIQRLSP